MPTIVYNRLWCKTCKEWTLHHKKWNEEGLRCKQCGTVHVDTLLGEIPEEKIMQQRERYKEQQRNWNPMGLYMKAAFSNPLEAMFREEPEVEIKESDAGQKYIDEQERKRRQEAYVAACAEREARLKEYQTYKHLGRNDPCACGSGKKYKKCCMSKFLNYQ